MSDGAMTDPDCLFVYGTLMRGCDNAMARRLANEADIVGEGSCAGRLYQIAHYPGLIAATNPGDRVFGELFRLREKAVQLARLDEHEGCAPGAPEPTLYVRVVRPITLSDRTVIDAWVYLYNRPVDGLRRIMSGRFVKG
jgi:gamma-glutamylcyclotransferase (GGCT)/AIG2-like uncharacterized protein YtfP